MAELERLVVVLQGNADALRNEMLRAQRTVAATAQAMARSMQPFNNAISGAQAQLRRLQAQMRGAGGGNVFAQTQQGAAATQRQIQALTSSIHALTQSTRQMSAQMQQALTRVQSQAHSANRSLLTLSRTTRTAVGVGGVVGGAVSARGIIQAADAYQLLQARVKLTTRDQANFNEVWAELIRMTQDARQSIDAVIPIYTRFAMASGNLGMTQRELLRVTETLNKAALIGGATPQEASSALIQISQGFARGVISGQEFLSMSEQLPSVLRAVADGLGMTDTELIRLARNGKLTTELFVKGALAASKKVEEQFARIPVTAGQAFQQLKTSIFVSVGKAFQDEGATKELVKTLNELREIVESDSFKTGILALASAFATMATWVGAAVSGLGTLMSALRTIAGTATELDISALIQEAKKNHPDLDEAALRRQLLGQRLAATATLPPIPKSAATSTLDVRPSVKPVLTDEQQKALDDINELIRSLDEEIRLLGVEEGQREALRLVIQAENIAREGGIKFTQRETIELKAAQIARDTLLQTMEEQAAQMVFENSLIGRSAAEQARLRTEFEATNAARKAGLANDPVVQGMVRGVGGIAEEGARRDAKKSIDDTIKSLREELRLLGVEEDQRDRLRTLMEIEKQVREGLISPEQLASYKAISDALHDQIEAQKELQDLSAELGNTIASAFTDALLEVRSFNDALEAANSLARDLQKALAQKLITDPLANFLTGSISKGLPFLGMGGGDASFLPAGSSGSEGFGSLLASLTAHAGAIVKHSGGAVGPARFHSSGVVGTQPKMPDGDVMVRAQRGEMFLNSGQQAQLFKMIQTGGGGNGGNVTVNVTASPGMTSRDARIIGSQAGAAAVRQMNMLRARGTV